MRTIDEYTLVQLLYKYEDVIKKDNNKIFEMFFPKQEIQRAIKTVDERLKTHGIYTKMKNDLVFKLLTDEIAKSEEANKNEHYKLVTLSRIYRLYGDKLIPKKREELKKLILRDKEYALLNFEIIEGVNDYEIITKEPQVKLSEIKDPNLKTMFEACVDIARLQDIKSNICGKFEDEKLFSCLMGKALADFFIKKQNKTPQEFKKIFEAMEFSEEVASKYEDDIVEILKDYLKDNFQLLNKTEVLLSVAARIIEGIKIYNGEEVFGTSLAYFNHDPNTADKEVQENSINLLRRLNEELKTSTYNDMEYSITQEDGTVSIVVNKEIIQDFLTKCTKTQYITNEQIEKIHSEIQQGILSEELDARRIAGINIEDLISLNKAYSLEEDKELKSKKEKCIFELIEYLKSEKLLSNEEVLDLYLNENLCLDIMQELPIDKEYYNSRFKELYQEFKNPELKAKKNENASKLERFSNLYNKLVKRENFSKKELVSLLKEGINEYELIIINDLYESGLLTLEESLEELEHENGILFLIGKYKQKQEFSPAIIAKYYRDDLDSIARFIKGAMDGNTERYLAICAIFPEETENDMEAVELLESECLELSEGLKNKDVKLKRKKKDIIKDSKEYITDPAARLNLFKQLDKNYSLTILDDGHVIVECPNNQKVIIEKLFDENKNRYYGAATYILDNTYYNKNKSVILVDGKIQRSELIQNSKAKGITRLIHSEKSWGDGIKEEFNVDKNSLYTPQEIEEINNAIKRVERSRKERE